MLDEFQKKCVLHKEGPALVVAGPGSGKTRVLSYRIKHMIEDMGINPRKIVAISFTRSSAIELKNRTIHLSKNAQGVNFGTFHSFFFRILRYFGNVGNIGIMDDREKDLLIRQILRKKGNIQWGDDEYLRAISSGISLWKNAKTFDEEFKLKEVSTEELQSIGDEYEEQKSRLGKYDFEDLILNTYFLLKNSKLILDRVRKTFEYFMIDEFQDINRAQYEVVKLMVFPKQNLFVVGDDDQSIYSFRGARPEYFMEFKENFLNPKMYFLSSNYRSGINIIDKSKKLIEKNRDRFQKNILPQRSELGTVEINGFENSAEEASYIGHKVLDYWKKHGMNLKDMAVLYRTNIQSRILVENFMDLNIPFVIKDGAPCIYDHWIFKDIKAYLVASKNRSDSSSIARIINKPFRYIKRDLVKEGESTRDFFKYLMDSGELNKLQRDSIRRVEVDMDYIALCDAKDAIKYIRTGLEYDMYVREYCERRNIKAMGLYEMLKEIEESPKKGEQIWDYLDRTEKVAEETREALKNQEKEGVILSTLHGSKGLEFSKVFICAVEDGIIPHEKSIEEGLEEEERRMMYVGMTRAEENLFITWSKERNGKKAEASSFLKEII